MAPTVHLVDAGDGASALLACAVAAESAACDSGIVGVGTTSGRAMLARGGLRVGAWANPPCGLLRLAHRAVRRAVIACSGGIAPQEASCWSAVPERARMLASCARRALPAADVRARDLAEACDAMRSARWLGRPGASGAGAVIGHPVEATGVSSGSRRRLRTSIGAGDAALVVAGAADAPLRADAHRLLDVAGRAMLAGADVHLLLPACMPHLSRTLRFARGLGLGERVCVIEGGEWTHPWWDAADAVLVAGPAVLVEAAAAAWNLPVVAAPGGADDAACTERRAAGAAARDGAAMTLIGMARARQGPATDAPRAGLQPAMNASAASA